MAAEIKTVVDTIPEIFCGSWSSYSSIENDEVSLIVDTNFIEFSEIQKFRINKARFTTNTDKNAFVLEFDYNDVDQLSGPINGDDYPTLMAIFEDDCGIEKMVVVAHAPGEFFRAK